MGSGKEPTKHPQARLALRGSAEMFLHPLLTRPDTREDYGEERWLGIGMTKGRIAFVAFAQDAGNTIRIISLRKANHEESKEYEKALQHGLEAN